MPPLTSVLTSVSASLKNAFGVLSSRISSDWTMGRPAFKRTMSSWLKIKKSSLFSFLATPANEPPRLNAWRLFNMEDKIAAILQLTAQNIPVFGLNLFDKKLSRLPCRLYIQRLAFHTF